MPEVKDSKGSGSDTNDIHQDRPTQVSLKDSNPVRQTKTKTYAFNAQGGRFKSNHEVYEDVDATLP